MQFLDVNLVIVSSVPRSKIVVWSIYSCTFLWSPLWCTRNQRIKAPIMDYVLVALSNGLIVEKIFTYLPYQDLQACALVSSVVWKTEAETMMRKKFTILLELNSQRNTLAKYCTYLEDNKKQDKRHKNFSIRITEPQVANGPPVSIDAVANQFQDMGDNVKLWLSRKVCKLSIETTGAHVMWEIIRLLEILPQLEELCLILESFHASTEMVRRHIMEKVGQLQHLKKFQVFIKFPWKEVYFRNIISHFYVLLAGSDSVQVLQGKANVEGPPPTVKEISPDPSATIKELELNPSNQLRVGEFWMDNYNVGDMESIFSRYAETLTSVHLSLAHQPFMNMPNDNLVKGERVLTFPEMVNLRELYLVLPASIECRDYPKINSSSTYPELRMFGIFTKDMDVLEKYCLDIFTHGPVPSLLHLELHFSKREIAGTKVSFYQKLCELFPCYRGQCDIDGFKTRKNWY